MENVKIMQKYMTNLGYRTDIYILYVNRAVKNENNAVE